MSDTTEQGSHHFVLTVQKPSPRGLDVNTFHGTCTPGEGATRRDVYDEVRADHDQRHPQLAGGNVIFWSLEPNQL